MKEEEVYMTVEDLISILKEHNYKITDSRRAIMTVLAQHNHGLLSVDELYNAAKLISPKTNMSTIYRNIEILEELNLLYKIINNNGTTQYKLICCDEHHHHIICTLCGKTEVIDFCPLETLNRLSTEKNFHFTGHKIELYGYCNKCKKNLK